MKEKVEDMGSGSLVDKAKMCLPGNCWLSLGMGQPRERQPLQDQGTTCQHIKNREN